jgi:hypothetical protein
LAGGPAANEGIPVVTPPRLKDAGVLEGAAEPAARGTCNSAEPKGPAVGPGSALGPAKAAAPEPGNA